MDVLVVVAVALAAFVVGNSFADHLAELWFGPPSTMADAALKEGIPQDRDRLSTIEVNQIYLRDFIAFGRIASLMPGQWEKTERQQSVDTLVRDEQSLTASEGDARVALARDQEKAKDRYSLSHEVDLWLQRFTQAVISSVAFIVLFLLLILLGKLARLPLAVGPAFLCSGLILFGLWLASALGLAAVIFLAVALLLVAVRQPRAS